MQIHSLNSIQKIITATEEIGCGIGLDRRHSPVSRTKKATADHWQPHYSNPIPDGLPLIPPTKLPFFG